MDHPEKFETWAVVEMMGHQRISGYVTEQTIGGQAMIRVDVPATARVPAYTKYLGGSAIYAITPCTEEIAQAVAEQTWTRPIPVDLSRGLPAPATVANDDGGDDFDFEPSRER